MIDSIINNHNDSPYFFSFHGLSILAIFFLIASHIFIPFCIFILITSLHHMFLTNSGAEGDYNEQQGHAVSLSEDGSTLAIGENP